MKKFFESTLGIIITLGAVVVAAIFIGKSQWFKNLFATKVLPDGTACTVNGKAGTIINGTCQENVGPGGPGGGSPSDRRIPDYSAIKIDYEDENVICFMRAVGQSCPNQIIINGIVYSKSTKNPMNFEGGCCFAKPTSLKLANAPSTIVVSSAGVGCNPIYTHMGIDYVLIARRGINCYYRKP